MWFRPLSIARYTVRLMSLYYPLIQTFALTRSHQPSRQCRQWVEGRQSHYCREWMERGHNTAQLLH